MKDYIAIAISIFFISSTQYIRAQESPKDWEKYIQKTSLTLLGKILDEKEINAYLKIVKKNTESKKVKSEIIDIMMSSPDFYTNMEAQLREEYLENLSKNDFIEIYLMDFFVLNEIRKESVNWLDMHNIFNTLYRIANISNKIFKDTIDIRTIQSLLVNNYIYSQINMGSDNFIISTFQYFIRRKPTNYELIQGRAMLSGQEATLFGKKGFGKQDFIKILLSNSEYWEGQVIFWFNKINNRDPSASEVITYIKYMQKYKTPEKLIKSILIN